MIRSYRKEISRELDKVRNPTKIYTAEDIPEELRKRLENKQNKTGGKSFETPPVQSVK